MTGYDFYLDNCLLPIAPGRLQLSIKNENKTIKLMNEGQVNLLKTAGLTDIEFECIIPQIEYPFAVYTSGFCGAEYYLAYFERLKTRQRPFQFIVTRRMPDGGALFGTNMKVSMEDYRITENAEEGFDLSVKINLKQYREYGTKSVSIKGAVANTAGTNTISYTVNVEQTRSRESAPDIGKMRNYKVHRKNDTLFNIAKETYGDGSKYSLLSIANKDTVNDPFNIEQGTVLKIPAV